LPERFADMATVIAHLLATVNAPERVGIATPADLAGLLPFARATRSGGPRDRLNDFARINVDVLDDDYDRGFALAEAITAYLQPARLLLGPVVIDRVMVDQAPQEIAPWAPGIFRFESRFTIVSRRHRVA
jgi:hypothetical protein